MPGTDNNEAKIPETITREFVKNILDDNAKYRRRLAHLREATATDKDASRAQTETMEEMNAELTTLRGKTFLTSGQVAVKKEDADALVEYRAINADPKAVAADVKKKGELEGEIASRDREKKFFDAAKKVGYKPSVLTKLAKSESFDIDERDVTEEVNGERVTKKLPFARPSGDDKAEWLPLEKFAEKHLSDFLPSLRDDADDRGTDTSRGREFPRQTSSERSTAPNEKDAVKGYVQQTYKRPSEMHAKQNQSQD